LTDRKTAAGRTAALPGFCSAHQSNYAIADCVRTRRRSDRVIHSAADAPGQTGCSSFNLRRATQVTRSGLAAIGSQDNCPICDKVATLRVGGLNADICW